jgi:hypothetical protein
MKYLTVSSAVEMNSVSCYFLPDPGEVFFRIPDFQPLFCEICKNFGVKNTVNPVLRIRIRDPE